MQKVFHRCVGERIAPEFACSDVIFVSSSDLYLGPGPGFDFHRLEGGRYTLHVNGPWCVTFEFERGDAYRVDYEQYH